MISPVVRVSATGRCHTDPVAPGWLPRVIRAAATSGVVGTLRIVAPAMMKPNVWIG